MMRFFHKKGVTKTLLWIIAVVVILSFGVLGNAYLLDKDSNQPNIAGKIFNRKISLEDFERTYQFTIILARLQYGQNFEQMAPMLDLPGQTWERLILLDQARRHRIKVSDQEVVEAIQRNAFFLNQKTQRFDPQIYQTVLERGLRVTIRAFEEGMRESLKIRKLFERQTFAVSISDDETLQAYRQANDQVRVSYVLFPREKYLTEIAFDEIKAKNYFLEHKQDFIQSPAPNVGYLRFSFKPEEAGSQDAAYEKAYTALASLENGKELKEVAQENGLTVQETGFFDIQKPDLALGWEFSVFQNLFRMKPGQYSEIIHTANSYDILQLREIRPPYLPPYDQVKEEVKTAWKKYAALERSREEAQAAWTKLSVAGDFNAEAKTLGLSLQEPPAFSFEQYLPELGPAEAFKHASFALTTQQPLSEPVETDKGYALIRLQERIAFDQQKYEQEKEAFGQQVLAQKKLLLFQEYLNDLKTKANLQDFISERIKK